MKSLSDQNQKYRHSRPQDVSSSFSDVGLKIPLTNSGENQSPLINRFEMFFKVCNLWYFVIQGFQTKKNIKFL